MKKKSVLIILVAILLVIAGFGITNNLTSVNATTVGQQLSQKEDGWERYDNDDSHIQYTGSWSVETLANTFYETSQNNLRVVNDKVTIKFYGSKFRLISSLYHNSSSDIEVYVDNIKRSNISQLGADIRQGLSYEILNLGMGVHVIEFVNKTTNYFTVDAIDIDKTGELLDSKTVFPTGISLNKKSLDMTVGGKIEQVTATIIPDNVTNKNVTWTSSNESVATVDSQGNVTAIKEGQAIITAITTDGSNLSDTCTVTVSQNGSAILRITMVNNERKEFDVSMDEILKFVDWYNNNSNPSYSITETSNIKPFNSRTDYIAHDKIASFEVNQYTNN